MHQWQKPSLYFKKKKNSYNFLSPFLPRGPLSQNLPRSRIHVKLTKQNQNKIKALAYLQILSEANTPGKGNVKDNLRPSNWDPQMRPSKNCGPLADAKMEGVWVESEKKKKKYIGNKKPREKWYNMKDKRVTSKSITSK